MNQGRWSKSEHCRFLEALKLYGKNWKKVQLHVNTRTSTQARSHAQKFFVKLERKNLDLQSFLDNLDMSNLNNMASELLEYEDDEEDIKAQQQVVREPQPAFTNRPRLASPPEPLKPTLTK